MTTTPPPSSLAPPGTPFRTDSKMTDQFAPKYEDRLTTLRRLAYDMSPYFVGPVPPQNFLDDLLPLASLPPPVNDSTFKKDMFSVLKASSCEAVMYRNLVTNFIPDCELPFMGLTPTF